MNSWIEAVGLWLVDFYITASLLLVAVLGAMWLIRQPAHRLAVAWGATLGLLALGVICTLPAWPRVECSAMFARSTAVVSSPRHDAPTPAIPIRSRDPMETADRRLAEMPAVEAGGELPTELAQIETAPPAQTSPRWMLREWRSLMVGLFLVGVALVGFWLSCGMVQTLLLCRGACEAPVSLRAELSRVAGAGKRIPRLLLSPAVGNAVALGLFKPTILLPVRFVEEASTDDLKAALAHEWSHVRNGDLWLLAAGRCLLLVLFAHPLYWLLRRRIRDDQEALADAAAALNTDPKDYAERLLGWARRDAQGPTRMAAALGIRERPSQLSRRIRMLLDRRFRVEPECSRRWRCSCLAVVAVAALSLSLLTVRPVPPASAAAAESLAGEYSPAVRQDTTGLPAEAASSSGEPEKSPKAGDPSELFVIGGKVLDPEGKPLAGAKLYVNIRSALHRPPKLKDPTIKIFEHKQVDGRTLLRAIHPKVVEVFRRFGLDPERLDARELAKNGKLEEALRPVMQELYEDHPSQFPRLRATSGHDGRFRFTIAQSQLKAPYHEDIDVIAVAEGYGPAWNFTHKEDEFSDLTLRLVPDVPIQGRIVDRQGRPIQGATIKMGAIFAYPGGTAEPWVELVQALMSGHTQRCNQLLHLSTQYQFRGTNLNLFPESLTTDHDGRFRITRVGAERVVHRMEISGTGIGSEHFSVMTRPGPGIEVPKESFLRSVYRTYGPKFEHAVTPHRIVEGTVRDKATGKALAGVQVAAFGSAYVDDISDQEGKYRLVGLPKAEKYRISVWPWGRGKQPYPDVTKYVVAEPGGESLTVDFDLVRGVVLRGRVTEKPSGKPVPGVSIAYATFQGNPHVAGFAHWNNSAYPEGRMTRNVSQMTSTRENSRPDGSFSMVVLPGPGVLGGTVTDGPYTLAEVDELKDNAVGTTKKSEHARGPYREAGPLSTTVPYIGPASAFHAVKLFNVPEDAESITVDLVLNRGKTLRGTIQGPDGQPLSGVIVSGLTTQDFNSPHKPLDSAEFAVAGLAPGKPRLLVFHHQRQQLGAVQIVGAEDAGPLFVELRKCGSAIGRLLDADKRAQSGVRVWAGLVHDADGPRHLPGPNTISGKDGRFRLDGFVPGEKYILSGSIPDAKYQPSSRRLGQVTLQSGEMKDLGDIVQKPKAKN